MTERFVSEQPGIASWHSFSAGAFYDPDNVAFGPVIGLDEHRVDSGAGFDVHAHRGVHIVTRVLDGTLRHEDSSGAVRLVRPHGFLVQSTGDGVRHSETNASDTEPLRFLQLTILGSDGTSEVREVDGPVDLEGCVVDTRVDVPDHRPCLVLEIATGTDHRLRAGDDAPPTTGELLVVLLSEA